TTPPNTPHLYTHHLPDPLPISERAEVFKMNSAELDQLVAQIGEEILARVNRPALSKAEGLNIPDQVCPGCTQRCPQTCAAKTKQIVAMGADRVSASDKLTRIDPAIARLIDHTLLRPDATRAEIVKVCRAA